MLQSAAHMATTVPDTGSTLQRVRRGVKNLQNDPRFIAQVTGAPLTHALYFYFHPNALRLARELDRALSPLKQQRWFVGGTTLMEGLTLYAVTRLLRPARAVELGVANGVSSAYFLQALHDNRRGELISIDLPATTKIEHVPKGHERGWLVPKRLRSRWTLQLGDAHELLPSLVATAPVDLLFDDCDHSYKHIQWVCETVSPQLGVNGVLLVHDIDWNSAFADFCAAHGIPALRQGNRLGSVVWKTTANK